MTSIESLADLVIERTKALASVPAPSLDESERAEIVRRWWEEDFNPVIVDSIGNVWASVQQGPGPALVVAAHLDTVFDRTVPHGTRTDAGRLYGPSVGDDSVAVAALSAAAQLLPEGCGNVWILATVGEEGLGNLAGIRHALANPQAPIGALIAVEGNWLGRICLTAVGSTRYRITLRGPGGHAWEAAEVDSAIHGVARIVAALDGISRPVEAKTAINVGLIRGGTAINAKAAEASFDIDLRASSQTALNGLDEALRMLVETTRRSLEVEWEPLGQRPAGSISADHELAVAAIDALAGAGITAELTAASTDANAAHAVGVPALAIGVTIGSGEHTTGEWIELSPIATGLQVLADTVSTYTRGTT